MATGTTYRFHTARLTQDDWPIFTGTMVGLGEPVDRPNQRMGGDVSSGEDDGSVEIIHVADRMALLPLVKNERVLFQATRPSEAGRRQPRDHRYLSIAAVIVSPSASCCG